MELTYGIKKSFNYENNVHYKIIENDIFGVSERLKEIDPNLYLVYNGLQDCYEIHDITQISTTYALTFDELNGEIIDILRKVKTRNTIEYSRSQSFLSKRYGEHQEEKLKQDRTNLVSSEDLIIRT